MIQILRNDVDALHVDLFEFRRRLFLFHSQEEERREQQHQDGGVGDDDPEFPRRSYGPGRSFPKNFFWWFYDIFYKI
jgi:hypothetical protein